MWRYLGYGKKMEFRCEKILDVEFFLIHFDVIYAVLSQNQLYCNLRCFVAKAVLLGFTLFLCGEKLSPKFCLW